MQKQFSLNRVLSGNRNPISLALVALATCSSLGHATVIETESLWSGALFGNTSTGPTSVTIGQSFTCPLVGDNVFDKAYLSFRSTQGRNFTFHLGTMAGNTITSVLASENETLAGTGNWEHIEFDPANLTLTPGSLYAIWVYMPLSTITVEEKAFNSSVYPDGLTFTSGSVMPGNVQTFSQNDLAFRVELVVPEPTTITLLALGGLGLAAMRKRRA